MLFLRVSGLKRLEAETVLCNEFSMLTIILLLYCINAPIREEPIEHYEYKTNL